MSMQQTLEDFGVTLAFAEANVPEASPTHKPSGPSQGTRAPKPEDQARSRAKRKAFIYGAFSIALYVVLFANAGTIMNYFTKGHFYCVLPVATALLFSYVHGTFTGNFWTALGVNASSKATKKAVKEDTITQRPTRRPRVHAQM